MGQWLENNLQIVATNKPTHWPYNNEKMPAIIAFLIMMNIVYQVIILQL